MTSADLRVLLPALERATGVAWRTNVAGNCQLAAPLTPGGHLGGTLVLVECWCLVAYRPLPFSVRRVVVRWDYVITRTRCDYRDVEAGRGWADRAAGAVVEMLAGEPWRWTPRCP